MEIAKNITASRTVWFAVIISPGADHDPIPWLGVSLAHLRFQFDRLSINEKCAISTMVDCLGIFWNRILPGFEYLEDEEIILFHEAGLLCASELDQFGRRRREGMS
jgi:hypothetical protein